MTFSDYFQTQTKENRRLQSWIILESSATAFLIWTRGEPVQWRWRTNTKQKVPQCWSAQDFVSQLSSSWLRSGVTSRSSRSRSFALSVTRWTRSQPWKWRNGGLVPVSSCVTWRLLVWFVILSRPEGRSLPSPSRWPREGPTFRGGCSRELPRARRQESNVKITSFRLGGSGLTSSWLVTRPSPPWTSSGATPGTRMRTWPSTSGTPKTEGALEGITGAQFQFGETRRKWKGVGSCEENCCCYEGRNQLFKNKAPAPRIVQMMLRHPTYSQGSC